MNSFQLECFRCPRAIEIVYRDPKIIHQNGVVGSDEHSIRLILSEYIRMAYFTFATCESHTNMENKRKPI